MRKMLLFSVVALSGLGFVGCQTEVPAENTSKASASISPPSCKGNACGDVSYRYANGQNWFKNNGSRVVEIRLNNWAAGNTFQLNPGDEKPSGLKVFNSPYEANYK
jgi:hypothetical protein